MPGMSFCPSRAIMTAAVISLLRLCAMQVAASQASQISGTSGTHGTSAVAAAQPTVRRSEHGGAFPRGAGQAGQERILADGGCPDDEEESFFVDSLITDLKNPIGGCYESSTIANSWTSGNSSYYALGGGGPTKGQSWIYETSAGVWVIGVVEEIDEVTGEASSPKIVCSSFINLNDQSDELSGPADPQLNGVWKCSYFEGGMTNRVEADFEGVECGCAGRTISGQSSGKEKYSSVAIAIATLTALVALLVIVCLCLLHLKKRRSPAQVSACKEEHIADKEGAIAPKEDAIVPKEDALAPEEDPLASTQDALAPTGEAPEPKEDTLASAEATLTV